jgi:hypothetical protein
MASSNPNYIGKCRAKGCRHATLVARADVQDLDSGRWAKSARTGEKVLLTLDGRSYDRTRPFILNGVAVTARCPDHGVYRLQAVRGKLAPEHKCDARCMNATGHNCECSCGGANHGLAHGSDNGVKPEKSAAAA